MKVNARKKTTAHPIQEYLHGAKTSLIAMLVATAASFVPKHLEEITSEKINQDTLPATELTQEHPKTKLLEKALPLEATPAEIVAITPLPKEPEPPEILTPSVSTPQTVTIPKPDGHTYRVGPKTVFISTTVLRALETTGIDMEAMKALCARESDCQPEAINTETQACGLFQFLPSTLYETVYKAKTPHSSLVERFVEKRDKKGNAFLAYRPVDDDAKTTLMTLCLQPDFNAAMYAAYTKPKIDRYNAWLGNRTITTGELVVLNNLGVRGLKRFAEQAWEDKRTGEYTMAVDFFSASVGAQNPSLIKNAKGEDLTVRQSYNGLINNFGGWGTLQLASN